MYMKDERAHVYEAYETFENFVRQHNIIITDCTNKFEQLYFKGRSFKMEILDGVLSLIMGANLLMKNLNYLVRT